MNFFFFLFRNLVLPDIPVPVFANSIRKKKRKFRATNGEGKKKKPKNYSTFLKSKEISSDSSENEGKSREKLYEDDETEDESEFGNFSENSSDHEKTTKKKKSSIDDCRPTRFASSGVGSGTQIQILPAHEISFENLRNNVRGGLLFFDKSEISRKFLEALLEFYGRSFGPWAQAWVFSLSFPQNSQGKNLTGAAGCKPWFVCPHLLNLAPNEIGL